MSDIKQGERAESKLRAQHQAYRVREMITAELMSSFGYSEKRLEKHIRQITSHIRDDQTRADTSEKIRQLEEYFSCWFIKEERSRILKHCQDISIHIRKANTIWPDYWAEFYERRLEWDRAMACCNALQDELQYLADALPADKNKYMAIVLECETLFEMIKSLRQSDNRFKKHLKG